MYVAILSLFRLVFVFWDHDEKELVTDFCQAMSEKVIMGEPKNWD